MTLQEQYDILKAALEGKTIESRFKLLKGSDWQDRAASTRTGIPFNFAEYEYRLKPAPLLEGWVANINPDASMAENIALSVGLYPTKEVAERCNGMGRAVFMREVRE